MKKNLLFISLFAPLLALGNMASPIIEGTFAASAFLNQSVDILKENIHIKLNEDFETAAFDISYFIQTEKNGVQIPLLFYASDYRDDFKVRVDGKEVALDPIPVNYLELKDSSFSDFSYLYGPSGEGQLLIGNSLEDRIYLSMEDLKFFKIDLTAGEHEIRISYLANAWIDKSDWSKDYSFRYALSPAKYWKSFGGLNISLDATAFPSEIFSDLGKPNSGKLDSIALWHFDSLPIEVFSISHKPPLAPVAAALIGLSPTGMMLLWGFLLAFLHFLGIIAYRKQNSDSKYSWVVILGSLLVPLLTLLGYMYAFEIIDSIIGKAASKYHGYTFFILIFYPLVMPLYWLIMWQVDKRWKKRG